MKWALHTPTGTADILQEEARIKQYVQSTIAQVFLGYGYSQVETPIMEFYDVFSNHAGTIPQESMFKFFDEQGRILVLRPDLTTPVARLCATKLKREKPPYRICYCGNAFRNEKEAGGAKLRQFTQSGIELIGIKSPLADAEVIAATVNALTAAGLTDFQIDIGQVAFFKSLVQQLQLNPDQAERLRELVDRKNSLAIEELIEGCNAPDGLKRLIAGLPSRFGDLEAIADIDRTVISKEGCDALSYLKEVYEILCGYGMKENISIDLGMVQSLNYYTGIIIKGFTRGLGYPVCAGGRYDTLSSEFGVSLAATGVAIGIDRLVSALIWQNRATVPTQKTVLVCGADSAAVFSLSAAVRAHGIAAIADPEGLSEDTAIARASENGWYRVLFITNAEALIINPQTNERTTASVAELKEGSVL